MDEWIEIEGRSKQDAIERACNALNTNKSHLKFEVLNESSGVTKIRAMKIEAGQATEETTVDDLPPEGENEERTHESKKRETEPRGPLVGDVNQAKEFCLNIVKYIDEKAEIETKETDEEIYLDIKGERGGLLIGKYGQTLGALQYLVSRMAGLDRVNSKRLVLDSEQYRARRQESLESLAKKLADKAARTGRPVGAEPMSAGDRRIMHMVLKDDPDVTTKSVGEGMSRRVLIVPKGSENRRGGRRNGGGRSRSGGGFGGGRGGRGARGGRDGNRDSGQQEGRRRSGPPPRMHDSFDTPPDPEGDYFEEEDAPLMDNGEEFENSDVALTEDKE